MIINGSLGCRDQERVEFKIPKGKEKGEYTDLIIRRVRFAFLKEQINGILCEGSLKAKSSGDLVGP